MLGKQLREADTAFSRVAGRPDAMTDQNIQVMAGLRIPIYEIKIRTSRSSGPGGQHANVTASRVEASVEIESCTAFDEAQRARLRQRFGDRVTATAQDTRSQLRNRELALARLRERIAEALVTETPRRTTRPPRTSNERRLTQKRRRGQLKRDRRGSGRPYDEG